MSLANTPVKVQFSLAGGAVASYPFAFTFWGTSEVKAVLSTIAGDVDLVEGTDFTVSTPGEGGTLTRLNTWPTAVRLTIYRELDLAQGTVLVNGGTQDAKVYEAALDRNTALSQQVKEVTDRLVRFPISDPSDAPDMPGSEERASKYLAFDAEGKPLAIAGSAGPFPVSDFGASLIDDESAAQAQATLALQGAVAAHLAMVAFIEAQGFTYELANLSKLNWVANIANRHKLGDIVPSLCESVPVTFEDASITGDEYNPVVKTDADQDLPLARYPRLVPFLRAQKCKVGGVTDHTVSVSGSTITWPDTPAANMLLKDLANDAIVSNWFNSGEPANFLGGTDFATASSQRCVTVAGIEYIYTAIDLVGRTMTVVGTPAAGSQTASVCPHRIAGSTSARIYKLSGFVMVNAGDAGYEVVGGLRKMDRGQGHYILVPGGMEGASGTSTRTLGGVGTSNISANIISNGVDGTPRTGKTTDPRTASSFFTIWAGVYKVA